LAELGGFIDKGQWWFGSQSDLSNKSLVLPKHAEESHRRFPEMDYVLLVEPDMYPVASSFNRAALQQREVVYAIRRSGKESLGWEFFGVSEPCAMALSNICILHPILMSGLNPTLVAR
jgi:hypothetical protein